MTPAWVSGIEQARAAGRSGAVLTFNTSDRVYWEHEGASNVASLVWFLADHLATPASPVGVFDLGAGFRVLTPPGQTRGHSTSALDALNGEENPLLMLRGLDPLMRRSSDGVTVIIDHAEHLVGASAQAGDAASLEQAAMLELLFGWSHDDDIKQAGSFIVLVNRTGDVHSLLRRESGFAQIELGLPEAATRRAFARYLLQASAGQDVPRLGRLDPSLEEEELGRLTGGLRLSDIEHLLLEAGAKRCSLTREAVRKRKRESVHQICGDVVEVIEPAQGFDAVAGCGSHLEYFESLRPAWRSGGGSLPQGVLLSGPPGGGKSFLVRALARELESPCIAFRGVREQWVGASERNLDRALRLIESVAPCVLWTDEIDQQLGGERSEGPSGDSGVSQRLFGRLLEFFGESSVRGRVLWIATTNRPDLLDAAMRDRFSVRLPFLHPTRRDREALIPVLCSQIGRRLAPGVDHAKAVASPALDRLSVRALQEILVWAGSVADRRHGKTGCAITTDDLKRAVDDYRPVRDPARDELMALLALEMTSFHSLLPWIGLGGFGADEAEWPSYLDELVERDTGRLKPEQLALRIAELRQLRSERLSGR